MSALKTSIVILIVLAATPVMAQSDAEKIMGASKNIDLWFNDRRSGSRRGRSFNPGPLIEAFSRSRFFGGGFDRRTNTYRNA